MLFIFEQYVNNVNLFSFRLGVIQLLEHFVRNQFADRGLKLSSSRGGDS